MPIYEYQCECGERFECWRKLTDRHEAQCPACETLAPLAVSTPNFILDPVSGDFPTRTSQWADAHERANLEDLKEQGLRPSGLSGVGFK